MEELVRAMARTGCGRVATVSGRHVMDWDKRWDWAGAAWWLQYGRGLRPATRWCPGRLSGEDDEFIT